LTEETEADLSHEEGEGHGVWQQALREMSEEIHALTLESFRAELRLLNDADLPALQDPSLPLAERLEQVALVRERRVRLQQQIAELETAAAQQAAAAAPEVRLQAATDRSSLMTAWQVGLLPTLLLLALITAVGLAGILLPRQQAMEFWGVPARANLLQDGSFEEGTWQPEAGDCCNGTPGGANLSIGQATDATDGQFSLRLSSENHCACVSNRVQNFEPGVAYLVSLDYKAVEGKDPRYAIVQDGTPIIEPAAQLKGKKGWQHFQRIFAPSPSATGLTIFLYADSDGTKTTVLYDNVRIFPLQTE
jgi:hypothetical protein